jgi:hypothetical protein
MQTKNKLAVAVSAMALVAANGGTAAPAAQAQNEVLQATTTTFNAGGIGWCFKGSASATFSASGPATGAYPGAFTETNATVRVSAPTFTSRTLALSIPFTIRSGSTTITGAITNPPPYSGGTLLCSNFFAAGPIVNAGAAAYTATIQSKGLPGQTVSGTAQVSAAFEFRPRHVLGTPPTATLLNFPARMS